MPSIRKTVRGAATTLAAIASLVVATAVPSHAAAMPGCSPEDDTFRYCVTETGHVWGPLTLPSPQLNPSDVGEVVAYLDVYRIDAGVTDGEFLTCVALVKPVPADPCGSLGFERTRHDALVDTPVYAYSASFEDGQPLVNIYVCSADLEITGARSFNANIFTVCS